VVLTVGMCLVVAGQLQLRLVHPNQDSLLLVNEVGEERRKHIGEVWLDDGLRPSTESFSRDCARLMRSDVEHLKRTGQVRRTVDRTNSTSAWRAAWRLSNKASISAR